MNNLRNLLRDKLFIYYKCAKNCVINIRMKERKYVGN